MMVIIIIVLLLVIAVVIAITISMYYVLTSKKPEDAGVAYIKQVNEILGQCKIESGKGNIPDKIDAIMESLKYGDVNSPKAAQNVENRIIGKASELLDNIRNKKSADVNNMIEELAKLIKERENIIKNNK